MPKIGAGSEGADVSCPGGPAHASGSKDRRDKKRKGASVLVARPKALVSQMSIRRFAFESVSGDPASVALSPDAGAADRA